MVLSCNKDGMLALKRGDRKEAFEQLKYAEAVLIANQQEGAHTSLLAVTCNNLGCYYKKVGKFHGALSYLRRALRLEVELNTPPVTVAGTHLNVCAILSKLEKHDKAVQHALSALELIEHRLSRSEWEDISQDDYALLAVAYHNVGLERDYLHQYEKAASAFQLGHQVAARCLGDNHPLSIALGSNCDAVLHKSKKRIKSVTGADDNRDAMMPGGGGGMGLVLPPINGKMQAGNIAISMPMVDNVDKNEQVWAEKEEQAWYAFADAITKDPDPEANLVVPDNALSRQSSKVSADPERQLIFSDSEDESRQRLPPHLKAALQKTRLESLVLPSFEESTHYRGGVPSDMTPSPFEKRERHKTPLMQAMEAHPDALIDIIDAEQTAGASRTALSDFRPNRVIKGSTRTSRVVRRTAMFNCTTHRDLVMTSKYGRKSENLKEKNAQNAAATKIQLMWRAWYAYCQEHSQFMTAQWICATMIQCHWRSYHVRRKMLDQIVERIQRRVRGYLVRTTLKKHLAAVNIQRHVVGMLTRQQLRRLNDSALKIQRVTRGGQARKRVQERHFQMTSAAVRIQCAYRRFVAKRILKAKRLAHKKELQRIQAAIDIQRVVRGNYGRQAAGVRGVQHRQELKECLAATKLQAMVRKKHATKQVEAMRTKELQRMHYASNVLRRMWLGTQTRKKYLQVQEEFKFNEECVVTIQRFARGFLVRLRLWMDAVRYEEQLWAAVSIQRVWRGYRGRVKWEDAYEFVWRRELAAATLQRNMRGWLTRVKVGRRRRKIAKAEFDRARRRYRAAQRIQALVRAVLVRMKFRAGRQRKTAAAVCIQRYARGHLLRVRLWDQVLEMRATMIEASVRGYLVRNRRFHVTAKIIFIQRQVRRWQRRPVEFRARAFEKMRDRKAKAAAIQRQFRKHAEQKGMKEIRQVTFVTQPTSQQISELGA